MSETEGYWRKVWVLFWTFFKISALTVGGGYAMIPIIEEEFVHKKKWIDEEDIVDVLAIGQSVPGVIAANVAVFIGYRMAGFVGGLAGVIGVILPSYVVIVVIAACMSNFSDNPWLNHAFAGVRSGVCALILLSVVSMGRKILKGGFEWFMVIAAFIGIIFCKFNPIWVVAASGVLGLGWYYFFLRRSFRQCANIDGVSQ